MMLNKQNDFWVYIVLCDNHAYYTGYTNDLCKRYLSHVNGTGKCKFTRSFKPIALAQCWRVHGEKSQAMKLERYIKKLSRHEKEQLILHPSTLSKDDNVYLVSPEERLLLATLKAPNCPA